MFPRTDGGGSRTQRQIVAQFAHELDQMQRHSDEVFLLGTSNVPEALHPELIRPGRFNLIVPVPLPDTTGRRHIAEILCRRVAVDVTDTTREAFLNSVVANTEGFSGADLAAVFRRAVFSALREDPAIKAVPTSYFAAAAFEHRFARV